MLKMALKDSELLKTENNFEETIKLTSNYNQPRRGCRLVTYGRGRRSATHGRGSAESSAKRHPRKNDTLRPNYYLEEVAVKMNHNE